MAGRTPKVTVFMPVYNRAPFVGGAIESVLAQNFEDFELLIIDDGSTDDSMSIVSRYTDRRVRVERNDRNRGIPHTRNRGLDMATGDYIALLDSDDRMAPRRLERQVAYLERNTHISTLGGWVTKVNDKGRAVRNLIKPLHPDELKAWLLFRCCHANTSLMARTGALRDIRYDEDFTVSSDFELSVRLARKYQVANIPRTLTLMREHGGRITNSSGNKVNQAKARIAEGQLRALEVPFDQEDLARHCKLMRIKGKEWREHPTFLDWAEPWLERLQHANAAAGIYSPRALKSVFGQVWLYSCLHAAGTIGKARALGRFAQSPLRKGVSASLFDNVAFALKG
ncbi:MAG TPA: glycosyltransferase [Sphingobium sp.]|nr:glycosyltransferase [Sphingobium sp.]